MAFVFDYTPGVPLHLTLQENILSSGRLEDAEDRTYFEGYGEKARYKLMVCDALGIFL